MANGKKETNYQWNAADYAGHSEVQQQWALELMQRLDLRGDEHLLDLGCGDGKVTAALASDLPDGRVVGVDSSQQMINLSHDLSRHNQQQSFFPGAGCSVLIV